jgi:hypothetical protein
VSGMRLPRAMHVRTMSRIGGFCSSPRFLLRAAAIRLRFELVYHIIRERDCETKASSLALDLALLCARIPNGGYRSCSIPGETKLKLKCSPAATL